MDQAAPLLSPDGDVESALPNSIPLDPEQLPDQQPKIALGSKERLVSLDIFRGLSIAMMILVDNAGGLWPNINHSPWDGVTIADLVMPFFLFIVGMAIPLAYKRITNKRVATEKAIIRSIKLFILGIVLQGGYFHGVNHLDYGIDVNRLRLCGILQRIAFAYVLVSICEIWLPKGPIVSEGGQFAIIKSYTAHWTVASLLAAFYLVMLYGIYVPDWQFQKPLISPAPLTVKCGVRGDLGPDCNAVGYIDRFLLGINHLYQKPMYQRTKACSINSPDYGPPPSDAPLWCQAPFDPEGILSSVSAVVTCFIGLHYGRVLVFMKGHKERLLHWIIPSLVLLVIGILLHCLGMHMNKPLYTFSYMCFTAGVAGLVFSGFYILADIYSWRFPTYLLEWMGTNSLLIFVLVACDLLILIVQGFYWNVPENNLVSFVKEDIFNYLIPSKRWALLAYVLFEIVFWCLIAGAFKMYGLIWKF